MQLHLFIITFRHEQLQSTTYRATRINRSRRTLDTTWPWLQQQMVSPPSQLLLRPETLNCHPVMPVLLIRNSFNKLELRIKVRFVFNVHLSDSVNTFLRNSRVPENISIFLQTLRNDRCLWFEVREITEIEARTEFQVELYYGAEDYHVTTNSFKDLHRDQLCRVEFLRLWSKSSYSTSEQIGWLSDFWFSECAVLFSLFDLSARERGCYDWVL